MAELLRGEFENMEVARQFITAGNAYVTAQSGKDGSHRTFRVSKAKEGEKLFVSFLNGPDNWTNYQYLGCLDPETGRVFLTRGSRAKGFTDETPSVKVVRWVFSYVWAEVDLPEGYKLFHEGKCGRCGRKLTVPASVARGLGPECAGKVA